MPSDIVDGGMEAEHADDVRRSSLEARGRRREGRLGERHLVDHRAAAVHRRHCVEQVASAPENADAGGPVKLVRGEDVEVAAERLPRPRHTRHGLAAVEQDLSADRWASSTAQRASRTSRARWRLGASATILWRSVSIVAMRRDRSGLLRERCDVNFPHQCGRDELPGHDVRMVLQHREHDSIAGFRKVPPQLCATRLMPSVAPRTKITSSGTFAPVKAAVRRRRLQGHGHVGERW
jgi:hypothetical protein